jgi:hypothetical protein
MAYRRCRIAQKRHARPGNPQACESALKAARGDAFQVGDVHTRLGAELAAHASSRPAAEPAA